MSISYLYQDPIQAWAILHQIFCVGIPKRIFWWFNLLVCSTNLHIWSVIRDTLNELQLSNKLLQLDLKGFSQTSPDIHFPLSAYFQGPSREQMAGPFPKGKIFWSDAFVPQKEKKMKTVVFPQDIESRANWSFVYFFCSGFLYLSRNRVITEYQRFGLEVSHFFDMQSTMFERVP